MSTTTVIPSLLDHLVTLFTTAPTIGGATPSVEVVDGPMPNSGPLPLALWVGVKDLLAAAQGDPTTAAASEKTRSDYGGGRQEDVTVFCVAAAWTGNQAAGYSDIRASAAGIVTAVETVTAADAVPPFQTPGVTGGEWQQRPISGGLQVFVPFQIIYKAL